MLLLANPLPIPSMLLETIEKGSGDAKRALFLFHAQHRLHHRHLPDTVPVARPFAAHGVGPAAGRRARRRQDLYGDP